MEHHFMWSWPIYSYLFLAGLGAGAMAVSNAVLLSGPKGAFGEGYFKIARYGALIGPWPVIIGTGFLIFELGRPFRFLNLLKIVNESPIAHLSPMNFGGWMLLLYGGITVSYAFTFIPWERVVGDWIVPIKEKIQKPLAAICAPFSIAVAIYTAVLLGAIPSRPLWNSPVLAGLFVVSALSTGLAAIMLAQTLLHKTQGATGDGHQIDKAGYLLTASDLALIGLEFVIVLLFIMFAHLTVGDPRHAIAILLPGGELAALFWWGFIVVGLLLPGLIELFYVLRSAVWSKPFKVPLAIEIAVPVSILFGGFLLRYIIVIGGQMTGPVGL